MSEVWFTDIFSPLTLWVIAGCSALSAACSIAGCFTVLRRRALLGDVISHAALPGVAGAFVLTESRALPVLAGGAFISGWLSTLTVDALTNKFRFSTDAAVSLTLSVFYGAGIMLLTFIQNSGSGAQSGLDTLLFGKAAALSPTDVQTILFVAFLCIGAVVIFLKEFTLLAFDRQYAQCIGTNVTWLELLLSSITVLAVIIGIQAVGIVLTSAMLITPAVAARYWTHNIKTMIVLAGLFGLCSGAGGAIISSLVPSMPTGPWIVLFATAIFAISAIASPQRGFMYKLLRSIHHKRIIERDNVLKAMFQCQELHPQEHPHRCSYQDVIRLYPMPKRKFITCMRRLARQGYLQIDGDRYLFTNAGFRLGERIARRHRLWELYLTTQFGLPADHVHADAESIEHILTPAMEQELEKILQNPAFDPHSKPIPPSRII